LRLVKSPAELDYIRRAGQIVNTCRDIAIAGTAPGVDEGEIMGKLWYTVFTEDGDPPAHRSPIGNGASALNTRYTTRRKRIGENSAPDTGTITPPTCSSSSQGRKSIPSTCACMTPAVTRWTRSRTSCGRETRWVTSPRHTAPPWPNITMSTRSSLRAATMGATWPPTWMEQPMIYANSPVVLEPNMSFFTHMVLTDHDAGLTMSLGEQAILTIGEPEIVTTVMREPIIAAERGLDTRPAL
jgi:Xaa-Pro dipeptidase